MAQTYDMNLIKLVDKFHSEEKCRAYLEALRWPDGVCCTRCGSVSVSRIGERNQYDCNDCRYQFSVTSGTIFHDTKIPLWKWFLAVYMIVESKKSVSANQLKRTLGVAYKTAWYLCHRIRHALQVPESKLKGVVEVDESWVGGSKRGGQKTRFKNKALIVGAVARQDGRSVVRLKGERTGTNPDRKVLGDFVRANLSECAVVYTDEHRAYPRILKDFAGHETVAHKNDIWVMEGNIHTNGIEGVWSLFKRSVVGAFHQVSCKHLPAYLDEFEFRFNNRGNAFIFRDAMRAMVKAGNLEYRALVAEKSA